MNPCERFAALLAATYEGAIAARNRVAISQKTNPASYLTIVEGKHHAGDSLYRTLVTQPPDVKGGKIHVHEPKTT